MTPLLRVQDATLAFGTEPVLDQAEFTIQAQERICIVGRNGAGKSSLLRVLAGMQQLDSGKVQRVGQVNVAMLPQDPPTSDEGTVYSYVSAGLAETGALLDQYHQLSQQVAAEPHNETILAQLSQTQQQLEVVHGWQLQTHIEQVLSRLELTAETPLNNLSGGWLRRVALARALACKPDILLLDEPTNHLDIETVQWLEQLLLEFNGALVFISHDRAFIRALATRILDLDRGQLRSFPGDYANYLAEKEHLLKVEEEQAQAFDKKLAQEESWIRQGIKARRTRNEGRVRNLQQMRRERAERRQQQGQVQFAKQDVARSGKQVFVAEDLTFQYDQKTLVKELDLIIQRGDKIALVGPNGCGKSTLIKLLLGQLEPTGGTLKIGTSLQVAYFDQYRAQLDPAQSVADNVAEGKQDVVHQGRSRHIYSYLQDFLFTPQQARMPLSALSGGEKNRVLLARILLQPANVLVLDEPTNDLDIPTLELLEDLVSQYPGTVLLVSHDREFIENTATSVLWFAGQGEVVEIVGGFRELALYQQQRQQARAAVVPSRSTEAGTSAGSQRSNRSEAPKRPRKLTHQLQRELAQLPARLEQLEQEIDQLQAEINGPDFFRQPAEQTQPVVQQLAALEEELDQALERWEYLEQLQDN